MTNRVDAAAHECGVACDEAVAAHGHFGIVVEVDAAAEVRGVV